jgi:hypothetical protein
MKRITKNDSKYYTDLELALLSILGCTGNGTERQDILQGRYKNVQSMVNEMLQTGNIPVPLARVEAVTVYENLKRLLTFDDDDIKNLMEEILK